MIMPALEFTLAAKLDLDEILDFIAIERRQPEIAHKNVDGIESACDLYAKNPLLGEAAPKLGQEHRLFHYKRWVIIYRPIENGIEVMRIVDGSRDYGRLFKK